MTTSARTLQLLSLLQTHRFWPGEALAARLEVSERTLRRDVDRLRELGYPITASRGVHGGYQLSAGTALPPLTVNEDEAIALVMALGTHAASSSGELANASISALSKIVQVLPRPLRLRAEALRNATVSAAFDAGPPVDATLLSAVAMTTRDRERLTFGYRAKGGSNPGVDIRRHVEPHHVVALHRRWYLLAWDLDRHDWRSFRIDRISDPSGTRHPFAPRSVPGGDPAAYVKSGLSGRERAIRAVVDVEASRAHVEARSGTWTRTLHERNGVTRIEIETGHAGWTASILGMLGAPVHVVEADDAVLTAIADWSDRLRSSLGDPSATYTH